jgi:TPR repeat protein
MKIRRHRIRLIVLCIVAVVVPLAFVWAQAPNLDQLKKHAKENDAEAQFELAKAYLLGTDGVAKDSKEGVEWLQKAARLEHAPAQLALAKMYLDGREQNIHKDPKQGLQWLRKAADHGYAPAEHDIAVMYRDGDTETGVPKKPHEAATWFRKAARQPGSLQSQGSLEDMYHAGLITKQEANWRGPEPSKEAEKSKSTAFSLAEVESGLKGWITSARMATLVQTYGVNFSLNADGQKILLADGADANLLQAISASKR